MRLPFIWKFTVGKSIDKKQIKGFLGLGWGCGTGQGMAKGHGVSF